MDAEARRQLARELNVSANASRQRLAHELRSGHRGTPFVFTSDAHLPQYLVPDKQAPEPQERLLVLQEAHDLLVDILDESADPAQGQYRVDDANFFETARLTEQQWTWLEEPVTKADPRSSKLYKLELSIRDLPKMKNTEKEDKDEDEAAYAWTEHAIALEKLEEDPRGLDFLQRLVPQTSATHQMQFNDFQEAVKEDIRADRQRRLVLEEVKSLALFDEKLAVILRGFSEKRNTQGRKEKQSDGLRTEKDLNGEMTHAYDSDFLEPLNDGDLHEPLKGNMVEPLKDNMGKPPADHLKASSKKKEARRAEKEARRAEKKARRAERERIRAERRERLARHAEAKKKLRALHKKDPTTVENTAVQLAEEKKMQSEKPHRLDKQESTSGENAALPPTGQTEEHIKKSVEQLYQELMHVPHRGLGYKEKENVGDLPGTSYQLTRPLSVVSEPEAGNVQEKAVQETFSEKGKPQQAVKPAVLNHARWKRLQDEEKAANEKRAATVKLAKAKRAAETRLTRRQMGQQARRARERAEKEKAEKERAEKERAQKERAAEEKAAEEKVADKKGKGTRGMAGKGNTVKRKPIKDADIEPDESEDNAVPKFIEHRRKRRKRKQN